MDNLIAHDRGIRTPVLDDAQEQAARERDAPVDRALIPQLIITVTLDGETITLGPDEFDHQRRERVAGLVTALVRTAVEVPECWRVRWRFLQVKGWAARAFGELKKLVPPTTKVKGR